MPEICRFFGIIVRMYYDDHNPPHIHVEYEGEKAVLDFRGNIVRGNIESRTAVRLLREWIDIHAEDLQVNWMLARDGREISRIEPLE